MDRTLTVETPRAALLSALRQFIPDASGEQIAAWTSSLEVLQDEGAFALRNEPKTQAHSSVLEYELPREAGRRPDVLVLHNGTAKYPTRNHFSASSVSRKIVPGSVFRGSVFRESDTHDGRNRG